MRKKEYVIDLLSLYPGDLSPDVIALQLGPLRVMQSFFCFVGTPGERRKSGLRLVEKRWELTVCRFS